MLDDLSLCFAPGTVTALCGPSGSGKSTVASLLVRFYDPAAGRITVDGLPLSTLPAAALREKCADSASPVALVPHVGHSSCCLGCGLLPTALQFCLRFAPPISICVPA